jgi:hypothetical protein
MRQFSESDLETTAVIHSASFPRQLNSREWIACNARAYPRTRHNAAQRLYHKALGAEVAATVSSLYSGDEVFMLARQPPLLPS